MNIRPPELKGLYFYRKCWGSDPGWSGCNSAACSGMQSRDPGGLAGQTGHGHESPRNERATAAQSCWLHSPRLVRTGRPRWTGPPRTPTQPPSCKTTATGSCWIIDGQMVKWRNRSSPMGKMECKLHVTLKIGIQGFTQEAAEVPVVLCCPLHPSAGKRRRISAMTRGRIVAFEKNGLTKRRLLGVCRRARVCPWSTPQPGWWLPWCAPSLQLSRSTCTP